MKASIGALCHFFNTHRMVRDYTNAFYVRGHSKYLELAVDGAARARRLAAWMDRIRQEWPRVRVEAVDSGPGAGLAVGVNARFGARVSLGALAPEDVLVELYMGRLDAEGEISGAVTTAMQASGQDDRGNHLFEAAAVPCRRSGLHGYTVRVLPNHPDLSSGMTSGLIAWAQPDRQAGSSVGT
jgi:starch phosphorylase